MTANLLKKSRFLRTLVHYFRKIPLENRRRLLLSGAILLLILLSLFVYRMLPRRKGVAIDDRKFPVRGIDISSLNGHINWNEIQSDDLQFVFIKATEGITRKDPDFQTNVKGAKSRDFNIGAYHFFLFDRDFSRQADNYLAAIKDVKLNLPPVVDVEKFGPLNERSSKRRADIIAGLRQYIKEVEDETGRRVIIYTNKNGYRDYIKDNFTGNPVWICAFSDGADKGIDREWTFWQHAHNGHIRGIRSNVDLNAFYGSLEDWHSFVDN
jgi:lysozyme